METQEQDIPLRHRVFLALACWTSLPFYRSFGRVMALLFTGALLATLGYAILGITVILTLMGKVTAWGLVELLAASTLCQHTGGFFYFVSRTALVMWLLNLPDTLSTKASGYTEFCLTILRQPQEQDMVGRWYAGLPEIIENAVKRLASPS